jgi:hypothetical protein
VCQGNSPALHQGLIPADFTVIGSRCRPPASPLIFPTQLRPALHIHNNKPALFSTHHATRGSVCPAHTSHTAVQFPGIIKHTAQVSIFQVFLHYQAHGVGCPAWPQAPRKGHPTWHHRSEVRSMWIMTTEETGWNWMPCPTRMDQDSLTGGLYGSPRCILKQAAHQHHRHPPRQHHHHPHGTPSHRHPSHRPHQHLFHQHFWPLWRKSRSPWTIDPGHHLPPGRMSRTNRSWTNSSCSWTWTTGTTYWPV